MTISDVNSVFQSAMLMAIKLSAPILLAAVVVGLIISIFQAATQIHEQSLSFVPKLIAIALILVLLGPWMMESMNDFTTYIFGIVQSLD